LAFAVGEETISEILPILKAGTYVPPPKQYFTGTGWGFTGHFTITASIWTLAWNSNGSYCDVKQHLRLFKYSPIESFPNPFQGYIMTDGRLLVRGPGEFAVQLSLCQGTQWAITVYDEKYID
jgi:hypothetical protein